MWHGWVVVRSTKREAESEEDRRKSRGTRGCRWSESVSRWRVRDARRHLRHSDECRHWWIAVVLFLSFDRTLEPGKRRPRLEVLVYSCRGFYLERLAVHGRRRPWPIWPQKNRMKRRKRTHCEPTTTSSTIVSPTVWSAFLALMKDGSVAEQPTLEQKNHWQLSPSRNEN